MGRSAFQWRPPAPRSAGKRWSEDVVITSALAAYQECLPADYALKERPETRNRNIPEVDAICEAPGQPLLAIEHTRLQTFAGEYEDDARANRLLAPVQQLLTGDLPNGTVCILPCGAFKVGGDWQLIIGLIAEFLRSVRGTLSNNLGVHHLDHVPFPIRLCFEPELDVPFRFIRAAPSASEIQSDLVVATEAALKHKRDRLAYYRAHGYRTGLLLESRDVSLISWIQPYKAFLAAELKVGSDHCVDVLYAWTADPHRIYWFGFKGEDSFIERVNPEGWVIGPRFAADWHGSTSP